MIFPSLAVFSLLLEHALGSPFLQSRDTSINPQACRCFPGEACWPGEQKWNALNNTVGGRLVATVPLGAPCHDSAFGSYDESKCKAIQEAWNNPVTHIESTSSIMAPFWANQSCDPFLPREAQCVIGTYVQYAIDAISASDYQAGIEFANDNNIRLVIRNTAHDWLGKSTGAGALSIRTHNMKNIDIVDYKSSFYTGKALKVGAGVTLGEAYKATNANGLVNVGGTCPTVGLAGGYTQGAGHGLAVSKFGLGADQALEWEVVTAEGKILKANPIENSDLYWALAGGGGGTYAAVVSLAIKVNEDQQTTGANLTWSNVGISQDTFYSGIAAYIKNLPPLLDAGASGNWLNSNTTFSVGPFVGIGMSKDKMDELHQPLLDELVKLGINYTYFSSEYPTFLDMYNAMNPVTEIGVFQIGSRLIPRDVVKSKPGELASALRAINEQASSWISGLAFNVSKTPAFPNAVHPAWRDAALSIVIGTFYDYTNYDVNIQNQRLMTDQLVPQLSKLIPGGGAAYQNEGDAREPKWQDVFYGENYGKLKQIKAKYDPKSIFYARTAVGSDDWKEAQDGRLCRI